MQRINILLLFFLFSLGINAQGLQDSYHLSREALYQYTHYQDSTDTAKSSETLMSLLLGDNVSIFQPYEKYAQDSSIFERYKNGKSVSGRLYGTIRIIPVTHYQIFKFDDRILTKESVPGLIISMTNEFCLYEDRPEDLHWSIAQDTLTINNLLCQKAELDFGGRKWIAWFCLDIPIMDGPYKFQGLPGLIVSIVDSQGYFRFDLTAISDVDKTVYTQVREDEVLTKMTKKEFYSQRKHLRQNMYSLALSAGMTPNEQLRKSAAESAKRDNNHIEKY